MTTAHYSHVPSRGAESHEKEPTGFAPAMLTGAADTVTHSRNHRRDNFSSALWKDAGASVAPKGYASSIGEGENEACH